MNRTTIRNHIVHGETDEALRALDQATQGTKWHNNVAMLRSRYERMRDKERMMTGEANDLAIEQNRINQALLDILDQLNEKQVRTATPAGGGSSIMKWVIPLVAVVGMVIFILVWMGNDAGEPVTEAPSTQQPTQIEEKSPSSTPSATQASQLPRYQKYYVGKTVPTENTFTEIRFLELRNAETRVQFDFQNYHTRPITIKQVFLTHEEQTDCKEIASKRVSPATLEAGEKKELIEADFSCEVLYPEKFVIQILYELAGSGEEKVVKIDFVPYELVEE